MIKRLASNANVGACRSCPNSFTYFNEKSIDSSAEIECLHTHYQHNVADQSNQPVISLYFIEHMTHKPWCLRLALIAL